MEPAFTLIELLVAVGIVLILAALLVPIWNSIVERSQGAVCANNMRQVANALMAYRGEHNGWFPPGRRLRSNAGNGYDSFGAANFNSELVDKNYLDSLPVCPSAKLPPAERQKFPNQKERFRRLGGTYGINAILLQYKIESLPYPGWAVFPTDIYSASHWPFLLETGAGSVTWAWVHQTHALMGVPGYNTSGRNHGKGDMLNFMFLDMHMEMISRNDPRNVPDDQKSWMFPVNPKGRFQTRGKDNYLIPHTALPDPIFDLNFPPQP